MMRKCFRLLILVFFVCACAISSEKRLNVPDSPLIEELGQPFQLDLEHSRIPMRNYVEDPSKIDSISSDAPFNYEIDNSNIILLGRPQKPLYVLQLWSNGIPETIVMKKTRPVLYSFLYLGDANGVKVKGDFNDWNQEKLILNKNQNSFSDYQLLTAGRYEYRFVVDGIDMLDPYNKDSVESDSGWNSVLTIPEYDPKKIPVIDLVEYTDDVLTFTFEKMSGLYVLWQNTLLPQDFIENDEGTIKVYIPANAKDVESSVIRVWAENEDGYEDMEVQLRYGNVVPDNS